MMQNDIEIALGFEHVSHAFPSPVNTTGGEICVLRDVSLEACTKEIVCIVGHSGCGKTTLLNIAAGLVRPNCGNVYAHGKPITGPGIERAMMFQEDTLFPWLTVTDNVAFGPRCQGNRERLLEVKQVIELVGLAGYEDYRPEELSGGMRQRVALARALVNHADILLLDEPFASLDAQTREAMQELVLDVHARLRPCILLVTHDIGEAVFLGDRVIVLSNQPTGNAICNTVTVGLPHPRTPEMRESSQVLALRQHLREVLRNLPANWRVRA